MSKSAGGNRSAWGRLKLGTHVWTLGVIRSRVAEKRRKRTKTAPVDKFFSPKTFSKLKVRGQKCERLS